MTQEDTEKGRHRITDRHGGILMAEKRKSRRLGLQRTKMLLRAAVPQRRKALPKKPGRNSPAHTSRGMQM